MHISVGLGKENKCSGVYVRSFYRAYHISFNFYQIEPMGIVRWMIIFIRNKVGTDDET